MSIEDALTKQRETPTWILWVLLLILVGAIARDACSGRPPPQSDDGVPNLSCRERNMKRVMACDSSCSSLTGSKYEDCIERCAAARGDPLEQTCWRR